LGVQTAVETRLSDDAESLLREWGFGKGAGNVNQNSISVFAPVSAVAHHAPAGGRGPKDTFSDAASRHGKLTTGNAAAAAASGGRTAAVTPDRPANVSKGTPLSASEGRSPGRRTRERIRPRQDLLKASFGRRGFSFASLLAHQVLEHGEEWAKQTLDLGFWNAIEDARIETETAKESGQRWQDIGSMKQEPLLKDTASRESGADLVLQSSTNVAQYRLCLI
jgi:hypothetical protein